MVFTIGSLLRRYAEPAPADFLGFGHAEV